MRSRFRQVVARPVVRFLVRPLCVANKQMGIRFVQAGAVAAFIFIDEPGEFGPVMYEGVFFSVKDFKGIDDGIFLFWVHGGRTRCQLSNISTSPEFSGSHLAPNEITGSAALNEVEVLTSTSLGKP